MSNPHVHWSHKEEKYWIRDGDDILWFDGPLEAEDAAAVIDRQKAAQAERERIVAWLRSDPESDWAKRDWHLAKQIEEGEHLT